MESAQLITVDDANPRFLFHFATDSSRTNYSGLNNDNKGRDNSKNATKRGNRLLWSRIIYMVGT